MPVHIRMYIYRCLSLDVHCILVACVGSKSMLQPAVHCAEMHAMLRPAAASAMPLCNYP